jgi:uncharacterized protein YdeI (YjbR/CyaY-like superfamily)
VVLSHGLPCSPPSRDGLLLVHAPTRAAWRAWLAANHTQSASIWLVLNRKGSGLPHLPAEEAAEEALCFGWIDSRPAKLDAQRSMLLVSPRRPGSAWSGVNKRRVEKLRAAGLMAPAGLAAIERAKADGSWALLDGASALEEPADLKAALNGAALEAWQGFPPSHRRANLEWIAQAKRPETRAARIAEIARLAALGQRANIWKGPRRPG